MHGFAVISFGDVANETQFHGELAHKRQACVYSPKAKFLVLCLLYIESTSFEVLSYLFLKRAVEDACPHIAHKSASLGFEFSFLLFSVLGGVCLARRSMRGSTKRAKRVLGASKRRHLYQDKHTPCSQIEE